MEIVINIPNRIYNMVQNKTLNITDSEIVEKAIRNGIPQQGWIPVTERLPEDNIHVLCQFNLNGMAECYLAHGVFHIVGGVVMSCNEVLAWMPLPKPYEAESTTEQGLAYADQDT